MNILKNASKRFILLGMALLIMILLPALLLFETEAAMTGSLSPSLNLSASNSDEASWTLDGNRITASVEGKT